MAMIMIECSDGVLIDVDKEMAVSMSGTIRKQYENRDNNSQRISVDNINGNTLTKVLDFCSVYTQPHSSSAYKQWHEKFAKLEPAELCELASAAYYLDIRPLVDLTCKSIAKLLKGKSPAEIRRTFNILYDFAPGDDVPPPTIRDKLRTKLHFKEKSKEKNRIDSGNHSTQDNRSVDELLSFINEGGNNKEAGTTLQQQTSKVKKSKNKQKKTKKKTNNDSLSANGNIQIPDQFASEAEHGFEDESFEMEQENSINSSASIQSTDLSSSISNISNTKYLVHNITDLSSSNEDVNTLSSSNNSLSIDTFKEADDTENCPTDSAEDPALDQEVEEFRRKLESIHQEPRTRIRMPSNLFSLASLISKG